MLQTADRPVRAARGMDGIKVATSAKNAVSPRAWIETVNEQLLIHYGILSYHSANSATRHQTGTSPSPTALVSILRPQAKTPVDDNEEHERMLKKVNMQCSERGDKDMREGIIYNTY